MVSHQSTVLEEISEMKARFGVRKDAQLAEILGYSTAAIAQWKKRGEVPDSAIRRALAIERGGKQAAAMEDRRRELGHQVMYEGLCLALFLAPSFDAATTRRISVTYYSGTLRNYASLFNEIHLACAELVAERLPNIEGNASDAFASLTQDDPATLTKNILHRAHRWRVPELGDDESFVIGV